MINKKMIIHDKYRYNHPWEMQLQIFIINFIIQRKQLLMINKIIYEVIQIHKYCGFIS